MVIANEHNISVVYSGDETQYRSKLNGMSMMDQWFLSLSSLRKNWSNALPAYFIHTRPLSSTSLQRMEELDATPIQSERVVNPAFLMANKMLAHLAPVETVFTLFLDNDTYVHQPVELVTTQMMVAFDVLQGLPEADFKQLFIDVGLEPPSGDYVSKPAWEYYYNNKANTFPTWNSGVYLIETALYRDFCKTWEEIFSELFSRYIGKEWSFYLEQALFCVTAFFQGLDFKYLPKGYNYICTPRATELKDWPAEKIVIEHYAGDTSKPIKKMV